MNNAIIFHFVKKKWWDTQKDKDQYFSETFEEEKFIHASTLAQLPATVNRYYKNETTIYLLHIDVSKLSSALKYEMSHSLQQVFPHIYGAINKKAIAKVEELSKSKDEEWQL